MKGFNLCKFTDWFNLIFVFNDNDLSDVVTKYLTNKLLYRKIISHEKTDKLVQNSMYMIF